MDEFGYSEEKLKKYFEAAFLSIAEPPKIYIEILDDDYDYYDWHDPASDSD